VTPDPLADPPRFATLDAAVLWMRSQPGLAGLVRDAYLGPDVADSARRFAASAEFAAVRSLLGPRLAGARVLDLGAGTGIASLAFLGAGAAHVVAVEPDPSELVGRGALARHGSRPDLTVVADFAERLSVAPASRDLIYARQVLHHLGDLDAGLRECARVLRPGGLFLACREHVVDDEAQRRKFLAAHPMHRMAGGENAFPDAAYRRAIAQAGLRLEQAFGPWDSVINAYPFVTDEAQLAAYPRMALERRLGRLGRLCSYLPGVTPVVWRWLRRRRPGRMHTYLAVKPPA